MTIEQAIKSGNPITIVLLRSLPDSCDPITWDPILWRTYKVYTGIPTILLSQSGTIAEVSTVVNAELDSPETCNSFGLKLVNDGLVVGTVPQFTIVDGLEFLFSVRLVIYPWAP